MNMKRTHSGSTSTSGHSRQESARIISSPDARVPELSALKSQKFALTVRWPAPLRRQENAHVAAPEQPPAAGAQTTAHAGRPRYGTRPARAPVGRRVPAPAPQQPAAAYTNLAWLQ